MRSTNRLLLSSLIAAISLQGCATDELVRRPEPQVPAKVASAQAQLVQAKHGANGAVDRFSGPKLAGREVRITKATQAAAPWLNDTFVYVADAQPLAEVLQSLSEQIERRVRVGSMDDEWADGTRMKAPFPVEWKRGSISGFLTHVTSRMNASWRVVDGEIEIFQHETRSFQVSLPPGSRTMTSSLNLGSAPGQGGSSGGSAGGSSGNSGASGAQSSVSSTLTLNTFEAVLNGVKALVGSDGQSKTKAATVVGNPELGLITVTGRPAALERIARHVEALNERVAQNVFVQMKVMSVSYNNDDYVSLGLDGIISKGLTELQLTSTAPTATANGSPGFLTVRRTGGSMAGSELIFGLLKQVGDVNIVRSGQVIAANGQPAGMQIADEVNFLAQVSTTVAANAPAQTSLTPGSRTVGFTASVLPLVLADNRLLLQFTLNLSSLLDLTKNSSGGQTIQTPQIASQTLQQQAYVRDGESIVLFGFEQDRESTARALGIMGGGVNKQTQRQAMVIVMDVSRVGVRQ